MSDSAVQGVLYGSLAAGAVGMWLATSPRTAALRVLGSFLASAGLIAAVAMFSGPGGDVTNQILFWMFAGSALLSGVLMITSREPVYAALWFALATLGTCGLFMMQGAPFLAAATIIVYAGAIIVTFLFVIMLAQQQGRSFYDYRARTPIMSIVASWLMLAALLWNFQVWQQGAPTDETGPALTAAESASNPFSRPSAEAFGSLKALGTSVFGDYLYAVEIAGTLLLVAGIGAIAIAPRRAEGTL
jgi:NADH-quinone oxidoreductase subunit J